MRLFFHIRPFFWMTRKSWYSLSRAKKEGYEGYYFIWDIGSVTIGLRKQSLKGAIKRRNNA